MGSKQLTYNVEIIPEDGNFTVVVPDIPGCYTYGHSITHAKEMAKDVIQLMIESKIESGQSIPAAKASGPDMVPITVDLPDLHGHSRSA